MTSNPPPDGRDQQQAAELLVTLGHRGTPGPAIGLIAAALAAARREGEIHAWEVAEGHVAEAEEATRFLVAAARAEEAARWKARVEYLQTELRIAKQTLERLRPVSEARIPFEDIWDEA